MKYLKDIKDWKELKNEVVCGDCLEGMKLIPDKSIDLVLTSPPYDDLRDYEGFSFDFKATAKEIKRVLKEGAVCVWIVGDSTINGSETGTSFKQALYFKEIGMKLHDTMIYQKQFYVPLTHNRYEQEFEYMFVFSNSKPKTFNAIKVKTLCGGMKSTLTHRKTGNKPIKGTNYGKKRKENRIIGNIWKIQPARGSKHPAIFPEKLAQDHIQSWSNKDSLILDPFMGSWTTARACKDLGRDFIGFEISEEYCRVGEERLKQEVMF